MYLMIYDDSRASSEAKIAGACAAYAARFQGAPNIVLTHAGEGADVAGVIVRSESYIQRNTFYVGRDGGRG